MVLDNHPVNVTLWDTAGQEDYDRIRPCSYMGTDVFLVCFSVVSPVTFSNVSTKWVLEITHHCPKVPFILVGTKTDLRNDKVTLDKLQSRSKRGPITAEEGAAKAKEVGAVCFMETSALTRENLTEIFETAVRTTIKPAKKKGDKKEKGDKEGKDKCSLM
eukprot:TRINITY_DN10564_c1_g1_i1.p2 TRINITY_DN10564_c1_g1~~TRINITY_DN10564_c1_g1_i1.p2  ORF type:complete len:160 (+),score=52.50 TRINITY_DN10564_c1_g1_i1:303-782(+)